MKWSKIEEPFGRRINPDNYGERCELFKEFASFFNFDQMAFAEYVGSHERLLKGKRSYNNTKLTYNHCRNYEIVPDRDHAILFKRKGTSLIVYANQPYEFDKDKLEKWCNERDLIYIVCGKEKSFYYPGCTYLILIMSNDTYIKLCDLPGFPMEWEVEA